MTSIVTIIPVKDTRLSKQRTAAVLNDKQRQRLALTMLEDILNAVAPTAGRSPVVLVTIDPHAIVLAESFGLTTISTGAHDGHTGSVSAAALTLAGEGAGGFLTVPGDIPLITSEEVHRILDAHESNGPAFTISPSHDELGSNAVACSPIGAVPLRFGDDSFFPHLAAARAHGITPTVLRLAGIAQDIDTPEDISRFMALPNAPQTRTYSYLKSLEIKTIAPAEGQA